MNYKTIPILIAVSFLLAGIIYIADASPRVSQGDTIYLNGTYDITGVVGWDMGKDNYIAYCGGNDCFDYSNPYLVKLPPPARASSPSQYNFYIDPLLFAGRDGWWFQYTEDIYERNGNTVAFRLSSIYQNITTTLQNGTVVNTSKIIVGNITPFKEFKPFILPEKPISDYLLARGDTFTIADNVTEKIWIFGRNTPLYDYETFNGNLTYSHATTENMEPGEYYLIKHYPGYNNEFNVRFFDERLQWHMGWSGNVDVDIPGVQPKLVADKVIELINRTDDTYDFRKLEVQDPSVTIEGFSEVPLYTNYSGYQYYRTKEGYVSLFDVRGYTNHIPGSNITVVLDPDRRTPQDLKDYTFRTIAQREYDGNMSYYQVYVPIVWDDMTLGMHTMKVSTELGATMYYDFPISILPEDSFKPNTTVKYALDRNPWVPTPTPEVRVTVIEQKVIVEKTIQIPVTPSAEFVAEQQATVIREYITTGVIIMLVVVGLLLAGWYVRTVIRRVKLK